MSRVLTGSTRNTGAGGLPETIEDNWIENIEQLEAQMDAYIHLRQKARDVFELRAKDTIDPKKNR